MFINTSFNSNTFWRYTSSRLHLHFVVTIVYRLLSSGTINWDGSGNGYCETLQSYWICESKDWSKPLARSLLLAWTNCISKEWSNQVTNGRSICLIKKLDLNCFRVKRKLSLNCPMLWMSLAFKLLHTSTRLSVTQSRVNSLKSSSTKSKNLKWIIAGSMLTRLLTYVCKKSNKNIN